MRAIKAQSQSKIDEKNESMKGKYVTVQDIWPNTAHNGQPFNIITQSLHTLQQQTLNNGKGLVLRLPRLSKQIKQELEDSINARTIILEKYCDKDESGKAILKDTYKKNPDGSVPLHEGNPIKIGEEYVYSSKENESLRDSEIKDLMSSELPKLTGALSEEDFEGLESIQGLSSIIYNLGNIVKW